MELIVDTSVLLALIIILISVILISGRVYFSYKKFSRKAKAERKKQTTLRASDELVSVLIYKRYKHILSNWHTLFCILFNPNFTVISSDNVKV